MDQARIQAKVAFGLAKAAQFLGSPHAQIRPTTADDPLAQPSLRILNAAFDQNAGFTFKGPGAWGKPTRFGMFDTTDVEPGDYLAAQPEPGAVYFVAAFSALEPPLCIVCNRTVTISRPVMQTEAGLEPGYGGRTESTDTVLATGWPVSLLIKNKGDTDPTKLPSDVKAASFEIMMPHIPTISLLPNDRLTDETLQEYVVAAVEISPYGSRLLASASTT